MINLNARPTERVLRKYQITQNKQTARNKKIASYFNLL